MTITTSFSKESRFLPMYRFTLRKNAGYFGLASLLIFLFYPLQYLMEVFKKLPDNWTYVPSSGAGALLENPYDPYYLYGLGHNFTSVSMVLFTMIFLLLPFVLSLMLNSYMHSKKAADVYHALPVRRETLLGVNAAVAMTIITVPLVISNIIVAIAAAVKFGADAYLGFQFLDMLCWLASAFLIYAITTIVGTQVGTVFDTFLFSGVLFFALPILTWTVALLGEVFLFGFSIPEGLWRLALWLSPVLFPMERFTYFYDSYRFASNPKRWETEAFERFFGGSNTTLVLYLLLAVFLLWLAMRLYTRKHSEQAETTTSRGVLPTIIQFISTLLGGTYAGILFYSMNNEGSKAVYLIWCVIGGLILFAVLEVILNRGFKTLMRRIPVGGVMTAISFALSVILMMGGLGYETRIPKLETLDSVQIDWYGGYDDLGQQFTYHKWNNRSTNAIELTTQEAMQAVIDFQKAAVGEQFSRHVDELLEAGKTEAHMWVNIKYKKSDGTMQREYSTVSTDTLSHLIPLETSEEFQKQANPFFLFEPTAIAFWNISDKLGWNEQNVTLSAEDNRRLLEAIQADYLATDVEQSLHPDTPVVAHLQVMVRRSADQISTIVYDSYQDPNLENYDIAYTPVSGPQTQQVLRELNLLPEEPDLAECAGVQVTNMRLYIADNDEEIFKSIMRVNGSLIARTNEISTSGLENYEAKKQNYTLNYDNPVPTISREFYYDEGNLDFFLDEPEQIATLARNIVPSWKADEPYVRAVFYEKEGEYARSVLIPLSRLPVPLQNQLDPPL